MVRLTSCAVSDRGSERAITASTIAALKRLIARNATRWLSVASCARTGSSVTRDVLTAAFIHRSELAVCARFDCAREAGVAWYIGEFTSLLPGGDAP